MGRIQDSVEEVDRIVAEYGPRSAQHLVDLMQAAIRANAPLWELEGLEIMQRMIAAGDMSGNGSGEAGGS